ncbi:MAG: WYL domain-containing protein [Bacteroidales bacterium]|nr:WYL domain-containing protein [Bacteroidales bacterium]
MNVFNKYVWLVNTLRRKRGATLEELRNEWYDSDLNVDHTELSPRTLNRWKNDVEDIFGIIIECNPAKRYQYYIANGDALDEDQTISWMLHTITISNVIEEFKGEKDKIILDRVPSGEEYLIPLLIAIKSRNQVEITYHRFQEEYPREPKKVNPLCVRLFDKRWYLVVQIPESPSEYRTLALDRIVDFRQTEVKFDYPQDFNAAEYFADVYGISVGYEKYPPCKVQLKINKEQRPYTRALPLHPSQAETETNENYSMFEYYLCPTPDFARAILPFAKNIEVIEPLALRRKVLGMALDILKTYKNKENTNPNEEME